MGKVIPIENKKKKVYIVGFAPSWVETPWLDTDAEVWTLNEAYRIFPTQPNTRADRWFEIHNLDRPPKNIPEHIEWLKKCTVPLYTLQKWDFLPNGTPFPFNEVSNWLKDRGHIGYRYFTNSISWIIAFALYEGFEEIHVYGVDMAQDRDKNGNDEYGYQKPSCEYILGVAEKYAKVYLPETSDLLYCPKMYAVELDNEKYVWVKKQISELEKRRAVMVQNLQTGQAQLQRLNQDIAGVNGAMEAYRQILKKRL